VQIIKKTFLNKNKKNDFLGLTFSAVLVYCSQQAGEGPHNIKKVMRDTDNTDKMEQGYEEVCTGCGETVCLTKEEHGQWDHGFDNFMCWECE